MKNRYLPKAQISFSATTSQLLGSTKFLNQTVWYLRLSHKRDALNPAFHWINAVYFKINVNFTIRIDTLSFNVRPSTAASSYTKLPSAGESRDRSGAQRKKKDTLFRSLSRLNILKRIPNRDKVIYCIYITYLSPVPRS
jgi:hypothetical protein